MENGDIYKRKQIEQDAYQCGCRWERWPDVGDVLVQCPIHQAHTNASVEKFERERERAKKVPNDQTSGARSVPLDAPVGRDLTPNTC